MTIESQRGMLRFGDASFDVALSRLMREGRSVRLRPTTARLLCVLLTGAVQTPGRAQTKAALIAAAWPQGRASEQSLFQAISELRRALAPMQAIVTVPNEGYRFALRVTRASARPAPRLALVASVMLMTVVILAGQGGAASDGVAPQPVAPSLSAFARGVAMLEARQPADAERVFRSVLRETPAFSDARVLLGEAILAQGRLDDARAYAATLLSDAGTLSDHARVSALALMSRAEEESGRSASALHFALVAAERAQRGAFACAAADIEDRIASLMQAEPKPERSMSSPWPLARAERGPAVVPAQRPARCASLRETGAPPDAQNAPTAPSLPVLLAGRPLVVEPRKSTV